MDVLMISNGIGYPEGIKFFNDFARVFLHLPAFYTAMPCKPEVL